MLESELAFVQASIDAFAANKKLADGAIAQLDESQLRRSLDANTNSIAVIMKHVAGNLLSRWTEFLTTDGEKANRNRDDEFTDTFSDRNEMIEFWEKGWACLFASLESLRSEDLSTTVFIRSEPHSVPKAIQRSLGHTCYHIGQIVQLARFEAKGNWNTLTIPKGGSENFNQNHREKFDGAS